LRAKRVDNNQKEIIGALERIGCTVTDTSGAGHGFPDLVVGYRYRNYLLEIKSEARKHPKNLTPAQRIFHGIWRGQVDIVTTAEQAIKIVCETR
jgi:hypothetical protein